VDASGRGDDAGLGAGRREGDVYQRILVPLDGSPLMGRVLEVSAAVAFAFDARMTLLQAHNWSERFAMVETPTIEIAKDAGHTEAMEAQALLDEQAARFRDAGLSVETVVVDAPPSRAILEESAREPGTLVVIGAHDRGWLARLVKGSTLDEVLGRIETAVLIIREGA
jgi:nucleotide-binding universal stress UspA family protein